MGADYSAWKWKLEQLSDRPPGSRNSQAGDAGKEDVKSAVAEERKQNRPAHHGTIEQICLIFFPAPG